MTQTLNKLPHELTNCWLDDQRMDFLFSEFPATCDGNPENWNTKMDFWVGLITDLCSNSSLLCIDIETVSKWVERKGRKPLGLSKVWDALIQQKKIVNATEHIGDMTMNSSWMGWGVNVFVRKPTIWMAGKVLSPLKTLSPVKSLKGRSEQYICPTQLKRKCDELIAIMQGVFENLHNNLHTISYSDMLVHVGSIVSTKKDFDVLLLTLEYYKKIVVFTTEAENSEKGEVISSILSHKFIKFLKKSETKVSPLNETDTGIVKLQQTKLALEKQIENAYIEENKLLRSAKEHLQKGQRVSAKGALRQKQRLTAGLKKREISLDNIQQLLERIDQCKTDKMIMEAYEAGMAAYNATNKAGGLNIDAVDDTMNDLKDMLGDCDEINSTLSQSVSQDVNDDELEEELMSLLKDKEDLLSNQTDADVAKLVAGMSSLTTKGNQPPSPAANAPIQNLSGSPHRKSSNRNKPSACLAQTN